MSNKANINRRQSIKAMVAGTASVAGLSSSALSQTLHHAELNPNKIKLKFGVINDVHHTITKHNLEPDIGEHSEWIKAFAEAMNAANASFVVSNGDQVHEGYNGSIPSRYKETEFIRNLETYKENMGFFKGPSYYVLGNHECCGAIDKDAIRSIWHYPEGNQFIPDNYFQFDYPGQKLRFIVLDSQCEPDGTDKKPFCEGYAEGYIPFQQLQWLCEQLEYVRRNNYLAIIFSHQILGDIHYPYGVSNAVEVQRVIESYSDVVPVAFHGHLHDNAVQRQNGVTYVSVRRRIVDLSADWAKRFGDWLLVEVFSDNSIRVTGHGAALSLNI